MGLFNFKKKDQDEVAEEKPRPQRNPSTMLMIRLLAIGYLLWTVKGMIELYIAGGEDAPSLALLIGSCAFFILGSAWIGWISWKEYKQLKAQQAEEAALLAEEEDDEEQEEYEQLEAPEEEPEEETEE